MNDNLTALAPRLAQKLNLPQAGVNAVLQLLAEAATVPFIARYRKDKTGGLDEVQIQAVNDEAKAMAAFDDRKVFIEKAITEAGKMTEDIAARLNAAALMSELEDIYLPFKPKRKTRAQAAREKGLQPLADLIWEQNPTDDPEAFAATLLNENVASIDEAIQGARDIIAEQVNEDVQARGRLRKMFEGEGKLYAKVLADKEAVAAKFKDYFDFSEPLSKIPGHRVLAVMRGFMEGFLKMEILVEEEAALQALEQLFLKDQGRSGQIVKRALKDAYRRLLQPALESEFRLALKTKADEEAIEVFAENLRQLLLSAPLGSKRVLAVDPGYRTGCKVVCLDETGKLLATDLIYVHEKNNRLLDAEHKIRTLVTTHNIEAIAVGDGTAGRETEQFLAGLKLGLPIFLVNEDGASIYSASEAAREEFPDQDITVRGSVSIGRRLMDPLGELVKIDPKSIGVGQYQHDVNQVRLKEKLDQVVVSCVNAVGVNLNTAGKHLLSYVSGIGPSLAENIIQYRNQNGLFTNRTQLLKVPRLGSKAFEQCAGFLRIKNGENPLDAGGVHPESYAVVEKIAQDLQLDLKELVGNEARIKELDPRKYVSDTVGALGIKDILNELKKPGLDPRAVAESFSFAQIFSIEDVREGMIVPGIVTNITRFGAFVDIGVKQDGLVHVSEVAHRYISDPGEVLKLNMQVMVKVVQADIARKRIALSIKQATEPPAALPKSRRPQKPERNEKPKQEASYDDALNALRQKFKK